MPHTRVRVREQFVLRKSMDYGDIVGAAPKNLFVTGLGKRAPMFASTIGGRIN